jgi:hypothetical protein
LFLPSFIQFAYLSYCLFVLANSVAH